jgi:hypothetical protein
MYETNVMMMMMMMKKSGREECEGLEKEAVNRQTTARSVNSSNSGSPDGWKHACMDAWVEKRKGRGRRGEGRE